MNALSCDEIRELAVEYELDGLSPSVAAAVRDHLAAHPGAHPEYAELAGVAPALAYLSDPVAPPPAFKGRLLAAVAATEQLAATERVAVTEQVAAPPPVTAGEPDRRARQSIGSEPSRRWALGPRRAAVVQWAFAAAAVLVIAGLAFANLSLQRDISNSRQFTDTLHRAVSLASAPGSRIAIIGPASDGGAAGSGAPLGPSGLAVIPPSGSGVLVIEGLGATEGSQVYEAWSIAGNEAPVPIGSFGVGGDGLGWLSDLTVPSSGNVVVALTKEPAPGATKPTLPVVAAGTATPHT
jgi:hypothetical protein